MSEKGKKRREEEELNQNESIFFSLKDFSFLRRRNQQTIKMKQRLDFYVATQQQKRRGKRKLTAKWEGKLMVFLPFYGTCFSSHSFGIIFIFFSFFLVFSGATALESKHIGEIKRKAIKDVCLRIEFERGVKRGREHSHDAKRCDSRRIFCNSVIFKEFHILCKKSERKKDIFEKN